MSPERWGWLERQACALDRLGGPPIGGGVLNDHQRELLDRVLQKHGLNVEAADEVLDEFAEVEAAAPSQRELQVLMLIAEGRTNLEIAELLFISTETVKTHTRHLLDKLHARTRSHAVALAYQQGLLKIEAA